MTRVGRTIVQREAAAMDTPAISDITVAAALEGNDPLAVRTLFVFLSHLLWPIGRAMASEGHEADELITTFLDDFFLADHAVAPTCADVSNYVVGGFRNHLRNTVRNDDTRRSTYARAASDSPETAESIVAECQSAYSIHAARGGLAPNIIAGPAKAALARHLVAGLSREEKIILGGLSAAVPVRQIAEWVGIEYSACRVRIHRLRARLHREAADYASSLADGERAKLETFVGPLPASGKREKQ